MVEILGAGSEKLSQGRVEKGSQPRDGRLNEAKGQFLDLAVEARIGGRPSVRYSASLRVIIILRVHELLLLYECTSAQLYKLLYRIRFESIFLVSL
jgi:hypothetical protein